MKRVLSSLIASVYLIIAVQFCLAQVNCQNSNALLDQKIDIDLSNTTMLFVVNKLAFNYRIPIGLEWASDHRQKVYEKMQTENNIITWKNDNLKIKSGTLRQVLDSLVLQETQYKWECFEEVINIIPVESRDEFLKKLLDTKIKSFSPEKELSKFSVRDMLVETSEVRNLMNSEKVKLIKRDYPNSHYRYPDNEIIISASDTNFRSVLNKIVRTNIHKIWIVERLGNNFLVTF